MIRVIGCIGSTPSIGSVIISWWRVGTIRTLAPASAATARSQAPAASTTVSQRIVPCSVSTPATASPRRTIPVTSVCGSIRTPSRSAALA